MESRSFESEYGRRPWYVFPASVRRSGGAKHNSAHAPCQPAIEKAPPWKNEAGMSGNGCPSAAVATGPRPFCEAS